MKNSVKISAYLNAVLVYLLLFYSSALFAETYNHTFEVKPDGKLTIETDVGSIKIHTHDKPVIELSIETKNEQNEFSYRHDLSDGNLTLIGEINSKNRWVKNLRVEFKLLIPKQYNINLDTSGGSLSIEDIIGEVKAETSGGSIKVGNIEGNVNLHTSGGSITTESVTGNLNAHTSGGSINVKINNQLTEDAKLTTSGGSITAYLIPNIKVDILASTSGGRVKSEFDINGRIKKNYVKGTINNGGPKLTLKTSGGSIKIKEI